MLKLTLTQQPYIDGHDGAFLRKGNSANGLWGAWYAAGAEDADGNTYTVYWSITGDLADEEASSHCNWDAPYMILDEDGRDVSDNYTI